MPWKIVITGNLLDSKKGAPRPMLCLAETGTCRDIKNTDDTIIIAYLRREKTIIGLMVA